jgi:hypothetical protein
VRGGDALLEEPRGGIGAVEAERGDVEQGRPASRRPDDREAVELAHRLVAAALPLRVGRDQVVVAGPQRLARPDLGEAAGHQPVVDLRARHGVRQLRRHDDPPDAPGDHPLLHAGRADGHRPVAHPRQRRRLADLAPVVEDALEAAPVQEPEVALRAQPRDRFPLLVAGDPTRRERRVVDEHDARSVRRGSPQRLEVQPPLAAVGVQRHEPRLGSGQPHAVDHAGVRRVGQDDLVAGVGEAEEGIEHGLALPAGDDDLAARVVRRPAPPPHVLGDRLLEVLAAVEREPAVGVVLADRGAGRLERGGRRRDIRVQVLHAQDIRVVARRGGDLVDVEARDVPQAVDGHAATLSAPARRARRR